MLQHSYLIITGVQAKFFGQKQAAINGKIFFFIYKTKKNGIHSV